MGIGLPGRRGGRRAADPAARRGCHADREPAHRTGAGEETTPARPSFERLRQDEGWSALCDPARRMRWFDALKCVPLSAGRATWLSLGGEVRERYEYTHHPLWGEDPKTRMVSFSNGTSSIATCIWVRTCACSGSSIAPWRTAAPDHRVRARRIGSICRQGFLDLSTPLGAVPRPRCGSAGSCATARHGSSTCARAERPAQVRRGSGAHRGGGWQVDGIAVPHADSAGCVRRRINDAQALWGAYAVGRSPAWLPFGSALDLYYLGYTERRRASTRARRRKPGTRWASGSGASGRDGTGTGSSSTSSAASDARTSAPGASPRRRATRRARTLVATPGPLGQHCQHRNPGRPTTTCRPSTRCSHAATTSPNWRCSAAQFLQPPSRAHRPPDRAAVAHCRRGLLLAAGARDGIYSPSGRLLRSGGRATRAMSAPSSRSTRPGRSTRT